VLSENRPAAINPRIGGGYPFSHIAGANLPAALIAWANGQQPDAAWFRIGPNVAASDLTP